MKKHKNSFKRFYDRDLIYFITLNTDKKYPYFKEDIFCDLFIEELKLCKKIKKFKLYAFIIMYNHVHLIIRPHDDFNISKIMKSLKENYYRDMNYIIFNNKYVGDKSTCRLHIRYLIKNNYIDNTIKHSFKWQKSFYDHYMRDEVDYVNHLNYLYRNPLKHGVQEDYENYKWSSLNKTFDNIIDK